MASISAPCIGFGSCLKPLSCSNQANLKLTSLGIAQNRAIFPSLKLRRFRVCCVAKTETVTKVIEIVKKQLALPDGANLTAESEFSELGADSLDTVEIVMTLEEEFGITVDESNSQNITTVQSAADLIQDLVQKKNEAAA